MRPWAYTGSSVDSMSRFRDAAFRAVAIMELTFGWSVRVLAHGGTEERGRELSRKTRALIRHDRILNGRPVK